MNFIRKNLDRIFLVLVLISLIFLLIIYVFDTLKKKNEIEIAKLDEIVGYDYYLHENDTDLFKEKFNELKLELESESINESNYAKLISSLFVIDFYTLNNKLTNMDIGGIEYLYPGIKDNFILKASDTIYKYVKSNIYGDRVQQLPNVNNVNILSVKNITFNSNIISDDKAYDIVVKIGYDVEMGYPGEVSLTIVHDKEKLVIVEVN